MIAAGTLEAGFRCRRKSKARYRWCLGCPHERLAGNGNRGKFASPKDRYRSGPDMNRVRLV